MHYLELFSQLKEKISNAFLNGYFSLAWSCIQSFMEYLIGYFIYLAVSIFTVHFPPKEWLAERISTEVLQLVY